VEAGKREVADALTAAREAGEREEEARISRRRFEADALAEQAELRNRLENGDARVTEMAAIAAWQRHQEREQTAREQEAKDNAEAERSRYREAQRGLAQARAQAKLVERHQDDWREKERKRAEAAEQDAAEDVWTSNILRQRSR